MSRLDVTALYWTEEYAVAAAILDRLIEHGRRTRHRLLAGWIDTRAAIDFRLGRWGAAEAPVPPRLAVWRPLARADDQVASCLVDVGPVYAARGRTPRRAGGGSTEASALEGHDEGLQFGWAHSAAGLLELGLGRVDEVIRDARAARPARASARLRTTSRSPLATCDLIEAYARAGRSADQERLCESFERRAANSGRSWAAAALYRCRGLLAPDGGPSMRSSPERCAAPTVGRRRRSSSREPSSATGSACAGPGGGGTRARSCARRSARSSNSARCPGQSARAASWPQRGGKGAEGGRRPGGAD